MTAQTQDRLRIESNDVRGFHHTIGDLIMMAVNEDGCGWKRSRKGILLYPLDNSRPLSLTPHSGQHIAKTLNDWHRRHVQPFLTSPLVAAVEAATVKVNPGLDTFAERHEDTFEPEPEPESEPKPEPAEPLTEEEIRKHPWVQWMGSEGEGPVEGIETNGVAWRCTFCLGTDHEWISRSARGIGGHRRRHSPETYSEETRARRLDTIRTNKLTAQVEDAIALLSKAIGQDDLIKRIKVLETENGDLRARLQMIEEAMRA